MHNTSVSFDGNWTGTCTADIVVLQYIPTGGFDKFLRNSALASRYAHYQFDHSPQPAPLEASDYELMPMQDCDESSEVLDSQAFRHQHT